MKALSLNLDAQPEEYYGPFSYDATGFKILVHDQSDLYPNIEDFALDIPPGFTTNVRVRRTKVSSQLTPDTDMHFYEIRGRCICILRMLILLKGQCHQLFVSLLIAKKHI